MFILILNILLQFVKQHFSKCYNIGVCSKVSFKLKKCKIKLQKSFRDPPRNKTGTNNKRISKFGFNYQ